MKVLVTGGAGKLGSQVVKSLVERGHKVNVFDLPQIDYNRVNSLPKVKIYRGNIIDFEKLKLACKSLDVAIHLAAILPPYSEINEERTMLVNSSGTENLLKALEATSSAPLIFSSSVSVYGQTFREEKPISVEHILRPTDVYSKSKIVAEEAIKKSYSKHTILRISGVYAAEPFEFPSKPQFKLEQRVEFIDRDDVVVALTEASEVKAEGKILNIAGGKSWRMTGEQFVNNVYEAFGVQGEVNNPPDYGYFDWYDTEDSQRLLNYQRTSFPLFKKKLASVFNSI